jgi:hypothetical protein
MARANGRKATWRFQSRRRDYEWVGELFAWWEVSYDPISDDYTPEEIDAEELFNLWVEEVQGKYENDLIPISWFVVCEPKRKLEFMPFQLNHVPGVPMEDFLTYFTWPEHRETGEILNWLALPVKDKLWDAHHCDKGGFIQQATGWKPGILQPHVYLPTLIRCREGE